MDVDDELARLVALAPGDGRVSALVRGVCGRALSLPPLPTDIAVAGPDGDTDAVIAEFAEQFSVDVSMIDHRLRSALSAALGDSTFGAVVLMYIADWLPRVRAGLEALGLPVPWPETVVCDHAADPADAVFNGFLPAVARLRALDAVTSELVRLRGAAQHNCRLCKSLREGNALDGGGSETLYEEISRFEESALVTERQRAALRYTDALIWSPARIGADVAAGVCAHFSDTEAIELTLDVMRNASNKVAVAFAADAPRVAEGTERYLIGADGQTVFG